MKKFNILLIAFLVITALTRAEVLFVEDFEYPDGSVLTVNPEWFLQWGGDSNMPIVSPGLKFEGYTTAANDKALLIEGDHTNDMPHHVFTQVTTGDVFVAFLLEPTFVTKSGYILTLRDEKANNSAYNYCGRVYVGVDEEYNNIVGLRFFKKAAAEFADVILASDKTYLLVMQYHIVAGSNNDEISLYLFDKMPTSLPKEPLLGPLTDAEAPDINPAHVVFHSYDNDGMVTVDGLRVATTFWEALGVEEPDEPEDPEEGFENVSVSQKAVKVIRDGQIIILRNGSAYNLLGVGGITNE